METQDSCVQDIMPSALRAYNWNAYEGELTLLQTWGTPSTKNESDIQKCVAGYNGNFIMVWDHAKKEECAALLFCRDHAKCATFCQDSPSIYPQPYKFSWLQPGSESDKIIESAYWRNNSGALLVRRRKSESYYVRCWTYDGNNFRLTEQLAFNRSRGKVKYTRIAMHENIVAVCSKVIRNSVTVQLWRENDEFSEIFEIDKVNSGITKLINLQSRQFCLITENELIVFEDKFPPKRRRIHYVKDACYDPKSCQLKVLTHEKLMIYNTDLGLTQSHKHSKIFSEQTAMNSSGEYWVTIDDYPTLEYFTKGKQILFRDFDDTLSLNVLSDKHVIIKNNVEKTMQCYSLQNKDLTLIWNLSCETGPRKWQVKESGGRYFLLTEYTLVLLNQIKAYIKSGFYLGLKSVTFPKHIHRRVDGYSLNRSQIKKSSRLNFHSYSSVYRPIL